MTAEATGPEPFEWPEGRRAALSLTFDDARPSQLERGLPVLDRCGVRATFYASIDPMAARLEEWRQVAEAGHEIGNHGLYHPCSGNFDFARDNPLESYTLERMEAELIEANDAIEELIGARPRTFAYPCGQDFVGTGRECRSYVPVVDRLFVVGRRAFDETHNHPLYCDLARATGMDSDCAEPAQLMALMQAAAEDGGWLLLFGHDVGEDGRQTTRIEALEALCRHAQDPANGIWVDTVLTVGQYVQSRRGT
jgi:peptidoglycan/xylan/chitin deacetylase (PgdA/CDA1 family)